MKKIAFFVEGQTEQIFLNRLVQKVFGEENISIILKKSRGGTNVPHEEIVRSRYLSRRPQYLVLIYDCGADNRVKSEILDNIDSLHNAGYNCIIGMRDLYPLPIDDLKRLERGLQFLPHSLDKLRDMFRFIIVVQEVETWFLSEASHFMKVDKRLTSNFIKQKLGFDPYHENAILRHHPAQDIDNIYRLVGKSYSKKYWQVEKLVRRLDFNNIMHHVSRDIPSLRDVIYVLDEQKNRY